MGDSALLIRADASAQMGTGHVMRCLALAQAWQETGATVCFVLATPALAIEARLSDEGMGTTILDTAPGNKSDAEQTIVLAEEVGAEWVVVDGYQFDAPYQRAIKETGLRLLFVDDYGHADHYYADLVLNQNIYARESLYNKREEYTRLLLGTRYALLRREFWTWRGWRREIPAVARKVLVTMGGADPENVTGKVIKALNQVDVDGLEAVVIMGGSNPHYGELHAVAEGLPFSVRLERNVSNMPELMAWADVAISAGGSTCWELALLGLPAAVLVLAENQRPIAEGLDTAGVVLNLGWNRGLSSVSLAEAVERLLLAGDARAEMARRGRQIVDGHGAGRVAEILAEPSVRAREANRDDVQVLFQWTNDPLVRQMSFHQEPIPWEEHRRWFERVTSDPGTVLLIVELLEKGKWNRCGQVRIANNGIVSISLSAEYRGRGLGVQALKSAITFPGTRLHNGVLRAYIKPENMPSKRIFERVGFELVGSTQVSGHPCLEYVYRPVMAGEGIPFVQGEEHVPNR
ncbi:MAG TPA: UDP-2,4-diacetamido-2,4,6-trideoxy-beta-L-altropyranose hydrolase [Anaerolineae bacterium]|nr:UDP-2,4-diacetamido-2,4,6-trideoxy-beta-L-altropyranose hydrolase [Anaerolineae bacterium]